MDEQTRTHVKNLQTENRALQNEAYYHLLEVTDQSVDWAYEVWDELVASLTHKDNHVRAIAAQLLCNLAKSDPEMRMLDDFGALLAGTRDERFVTARHCLQALWKIGAAGAPQRQKLLEGFTLRFEDCAAEKNCTLIRYDILEGMQKLYQQVPDETIRAKALALIETEPDAKYRKKYARLWKKAP